MPVTAPIPARRRTLLDSSLHLLHPRPKRLDDIFQPRHPIKIVFQFVDLPEYVVEALDLRIRNLNRVPRSVVLLLRNDLRLLGEVIQPLRDLLHQAVEVSR